MFDRSELKERAREQLGNNLFGKNWTTAVLACLVYGLLIGAIQMITGAGTIVSILIGGPLLYGLARLFLWQAVNKEPMEIGDLFKGFTDDFSGTLLLNLMQTVFVCLWSLLFVIPGIVKSYSYSMAFFIKADHPEYDWRKCLEESKRLTSGHKMDLFVLDLSFIGWSIIGMLCLGIGSLWVMAYRYATLAQCYKVLQADKFVNTDEIRFTDDAERNEEEEYQTERMGDRTIKKNYEE